MVDIIKIQIVILFFSFAGFTQNPQENQSGLRIAFYNVENLFHPEDDSLKADEEFTPEGMRYWTTYKYYQKINNISKVLIALGEWDPPAIVGLCEIENIKCLNDLIYNSPLKKFGYEIIHYESPDNRGIDVALLYRKEYINILHSHPYQPVFEDGSRPTRDILYVKGLAQKDTIHLFVNHWPSRYGGQLETAPKRDAAAYLLKSKFDSILNIQPTAAIIAMGDFNDHPEDNSMKAIMKAQKSAENLSKDDLINLVWHFEDQEKGTHKYQHEWGILDQFIVSQSMLQDNGLHTSFDHCYIFDHSMLLEAEPDGIGTRPNRTFIGMQFHGGYSDHLPIYLDVFYRTK